MPKKFGLLFILSAPSGAGKSTIYRKLALRNKNVQFMVTCTTRLPRKGERNGRHYFFLTTEEFQRRIQAGSFVEWARVHDRYYGIPKERMEALLRQGKTVLLAVDVQGAQTLKEKYPGAVLSFLVPPSMDHLRRRLERRKESRESIEKRLHRAEAELLHVVNYDYVVVNDRLPQAVRQFEAILTAESLRVSRFLQNAPENLAVNWNGGHAWNRKSRKPKIQRVYSPSV